MVVREDTTTRNGACIGLGQTSRAVRERILNNKLHGSVPVHVAKGQTVGGRVARMGQENFETSTRVTEPACNRALGNKRIAKTWSARARAPLAWQDARTQVGKYLSTVHHLRSPQPMGAHEVQDETCPKITVKEVWCVAVHDTVCNGHYDGTKHTTIEESCEEFVLRSETSQNSTTYLEHRDGSNFAEVITNFETSQHFQNLMANIETSQNSHSWPRTSRWMQHSQNT